MIARALDLKNIVLIAPAFGEMARSMAIAGVISTTYITSEQNGFVPTSRDMDKLGTWTPRRDTYQTPPPRPAP